MPVECLNENYFLKANLIKKKVMLCTVVIKNELLIGFMFNTKMYQL